MRIDPSGVDLFSLGALRRAFRDAPAPSLDDLVGTFEGQFVGPRPVRAAVPPALAVLGMPGWCGKRFERAAGSADRLDGVNLRRRAGRVLDSVPIAAQMGPSHVDGGPALIISYPSGPVQLRSVVDEVRLLHGTTLIALNRMHPVLPVWLPFLLDRLEG